MKKKDRIWVNLRNGNKPSKSVNFYCEPEESGKFMNYLDHLRQELGMAGTKTAKEHPFIKPAYGFEELMEKETANPVVNKMKELIEENRNGKLEFGKCEFVDSNGNKIYLIDCRINGERQVRSAKFATRPTMDETRAILEEVYDFKDKFNANSISGLERRNFSR
jgi:hypothetical protein